MARIAGTDLPRDKSVDISLTYIFGVGRTTAKEIVDNLNIDRATRVRDLTDSEVVRIRQYIDANVMVEGDLRREIAQNIKRKIEIGRLEERIRAVIGGNAPEGQSAREELKTLRDRLVNLQRELPGAFWLIKN